MPQAQTNGSFATEKAVFINRSAGRPGAPLKPSSGLSGIYAEISKN
jgi:hypothetical protein